ncbi:regulator of G protein signaling superfamily [Cryphonectria parasitica EP155]|uniref:Regulator of G protein signaling superfamily n=1 Tax=Cryphonectria parasitica (strain ATCC 38755 / EP155) TaxID=660469 RepID=A0A9P5CQD5_CRYP1|nr:regulator of G protein signaling superfamily [Cryphonectria parasitica EP155]KAF3765935.1 regulator of G protein signaling superfamily [Cryphonectria parasitica EP155]
MPSLHEILTDSAPQPYTLGAFMAYLSQNHCLETLEFTMEADRYRLAHLQFHQSQLDYPDHLTALWHKLIQAYIQPYGSREVNLPSHVRDRLLNLPCGPPAPDPSELDEAVKIVYELMSDSVLVPFVASFSHPQNDVFVAEERPSESRHGRSRSRDDTDMTDDGGDPGSPPTMDPMTPPTTPPTPEWTFAAQPGSLHKAISAHSNGWKKVGAKLGLGRRSRSTHRATSSSITSAATSAAGL